MIGRRLHSGVIACSFVLILTLWLYVGTLQPSVGDLGDSAKFQLVAATLGIPHTTGYPLYSLLARAFSLIPVGDVAYRVNLLSAVAGAMAAAGVTAIVWHATHKPSAAVTAGLAFGISPTFWSQAVIAEVYTLHAALVALLILLLGIWYRERKFGWLVAAAGCGAIALGNHASTILWVPAALLFVWITDRSSLLSWRTLKMGAGLAILTISQYAWLYLRARQHPAFCEYCPDTLPRLLWYLRGGQFSSRFFSIPFAESVSRIVDYGRGLSSELGPIVVGLSILGIAVLIRGGRWRLALFYLVCVGHQSGFRAQLRHRRL